MSLLLYQKMFYSIIILLTIFMQKVKNNECTITITQVPIRTGEAFSFNLKTSGDYIWQFLIQVN